MAAQRVGTTLVEEHRIHTGYPEEGRTFHHALDSLDDLEGAKC
jgi:hypothetical protein